MASNIPLKPSLSPSISGVDPNAGRVRRSSSDRREVFKRTKINTSKVFGKLDSGMSGSEEGLAKQVSNNSRKITILKNIVKLNIEKVSNILRSNVETEKKEQKEEQKQKTLDDEKDKRKKKEGLLEGVGKSVGKSLLKPVEAVGKSVKGILGRLGDAFTALFMGFVANKGIKMFQAMLSGDTETFKKMRNQIIGSLAIAGGIFLALNGGLLALPSIISTVAGAIIPVMTAIIGFLASPAGLIALGIAAGIATIFAIKKVIHKSRGGSVFADERKQIEEDFADAGLKDARINRGIFNPFGDKGFKVMRDGEEVKLSYDQLSEKEKVAVDKRDAAQGNVNDLNKERQLETREAIKKIESERNPVQIKLMNDYYAGKATYKEYETYFNETVRLKKEARVRIQQKYDKKVVTISGSDAINTTLNTDGNESIINSNVTKNGINTLDDVKADIKHVNNGGTGGEMSTNEGVVTNNLKVSSNNNDNDASVYAEMQYNTSG